MIIASASVSQFHIYLLLGQHPFSIVGRGILCACLKPMDRLQLYFKRTHMCDIRHYKYLQLMRMLEHIYELVGDSEKPRTLRYFSWIFTFDES